jgi:hypothetical protein
VQVVDDMSVLLRADFCCVGHRDEWLKEHKLEKRPEEVEA